MRSKSFAVRSRPQRAPRNSLASLPGEANERFAHCDDSDDAADVEIVSETFDERDVSPNKRHCPGTSDRGGGGLNLEPCIVCDISDEGVSRCAGTGCIVWFHGECLNPDLDSTEVVAKTYCPYCWYRVLAMRHESAREMVVEAEEAVSMYLSKETNSQDDSVDGTDIGREEDACSSEKEQLQEEIDFGRSREEEMLLSEGTGYQLQEEDKDEETDYQREEEDAENVQDGEEDEDGEETAGAGGMGDVSGEEQDQIHQQNEKPRRTRRRLILSDSEISSDESTNETSPSGTMKNQQRKHSSTTRVVKSTTARDMSSLRPDQRRRLFWTPEEEEMLKMGVEKFSAEAKKKMPWRKILEMGEEVFHETRTPADLKGKWRNMMGGRGKKTN